MRRLAPVFVRQSDDRDLLHGGMSQQDAFHFHRRNVFAAADNNILDPVANLRVAIGTDDGRIAGMEPAVAQRFGGRLGIGVIAFHDHVPAHDDFPDRRTIMRHVAAFVVNHPQFARSKQLDSLAGLDHRTLSARQPFVFG